MAPLWTQHAVACRGGELVGGSGVRCASSRKLPEPRANTAFAYIFGRARGPGPAIINLVRSCVHVCAERCRHHRRRDALGAHAAVQQFVLATPKTRSLTITIGDIKITSPPVQHTHRQAARGQPDPRRSSSGQQQRRRAHDANEATAAPRRQPRGREGRPAAALSEAFHGQGGAGYLSGQPARERPFPNSRRRGAPRASGLVHVVKAAAAGRLGGDGF